MKTLRADHPVFVLVRSIPRGKVLTYGRIATHCGIKNPRYVGYLLHHNPDPATIPCHRVVNASGKCAKNFAFGFSQAQEKLLHDEGITFLPQGNVNLSLHLWDAGMYAPKI